MAVAKIHLMDVNLNLRDQPVGYTPPVGPPVRFTVRYNQRDVFQPANFSYGNLGPQWTSDWFTYITDNPTNILADVNLYVGGGGQRTYTGFNTNTPVLRLPAIRSKPAHAHRSQQLSIALGRRLQDDLQPVGRLHRHLAQHFPHSED